MLRRPLSPFSSLHTPLNTVISPPPLTPSKHCHLPPPLTPSKHCHPPLSPSPSLLRPSQRPRAPPLPSHPPSKHCHPPPPPSPLTPSLFLDRRNARVPLDAAMQSVINKSASDIIKICLPNGLTLPFLQNNFRYVVGLGFGL